MRRICAISFDLDDTLWDGETAVRKAEHRVYEWLQRCYPRITAACSMQALVERRQAVMARRTDLGHDFTALRQVAMSELAEEFGYEAGLGDSALQVFLQARNEVDIFAETSATLELLKANYQIVAVSNGNADVHKTELGKYFDLAVSPADTGTSKPDPEMFSYVFEQLGVVAGAVVHVGDEPHTDIEGAQRAGMHTVWINRRRREWPLGQTRAHAEIDRLDELPAVVAAL